MRSHQTLPATVEEWIDPVRTALLVVNFQIDVCAPSGALAKRGADVSGMARAIERTGPLIAAARTANVPVVWLQRTSLPALRGTPLEDALCVEGSDGHRFAPPLCPLPGEVVIAQPRESGFVGTMADAVLDALGIETCVVAGAETEGAVEATARSAAFVGYHPVIAEDCVASTRPDLERQAMIVFPTRFDVIGSERIASVWRDRPHRGGVRPPAARRAEMSPKELLAPCHTAYVVVDMQNDFCHAGGDYAIRGIDIAPARATIPAARRVLDAARRAGAMVIWLRAMALPEQLSDGRATRRFISRHHDRPYILPKSWGQQIVDELSPRDGEPVIDKFRSDAFVGTPLHLLLDANDIGTIVLSGVVTQGCVESTARGARHHGYRVVCVEDGMASSMPSLHAAALVLMKERYAVMTSEEISRRWSAEAPAR
jgi:nicotinamidase-related amidase